MCNQEQEKDMCEIQYASDTLFWETSTWKSFSESSDLSEFDRIIRTKWDAAMKTGYFRYSLDECKNRTVRGRYNHALTLNIQRAKERRKPEFIESLQQPFDPNRFNFTKVKSGEIIGTLKFNDGQSSPEANDLSRPCSGRHLVMINVSPLDYGHILLAPDVDQSIPQKLTLNAVKLSVTLQLLSKHPGFRVGFNSLCALASVNHQHIHAWYLNEQISVEHAEVQQVKNHMYEMINMPSRAFAFQLHGSDVDVLSRDVYTVTNYMQENNIAHNLFITRGTQFGEPADSRCTTVRVYVWPRVSVTGSKNDSAVIFNVAVAELGGHILMYDADLYENITEEVIVDRIKEFLLPDDEFDRIREELKVLIS